MRPVDVLPARYGGVRLPSIDGRRQRPHQLDAVGLRVVLQEPHQLVGGRALGQVQLQHLHAKGPPRLLLGEPARVLGREQLQTLRAIGVGAAQGRRPDRDHDEPRRPAVLRKGFARKAPGLEVHLPSNRVRIHDALARRPHRTVQRLLGRPLASEPGGGSPPDVAVDDAELPAAPGALDVVAAQLRAALDEVPVADPVVALALHVQNDVGGPLGVLHGLAPAIERGPEEVAQGPPEVRIAQCPARREEDLRIPQGDVRAEVLLEPRNLWRLADAPGQPQRLHHVVGLHGIDLAGEEAPQLLAARQASDVSARQDPADQVLRVCVHAHAQRLPLCSAVNQLRARHAGQTQRRAAEHCGHCFDLAPGGDGGEQRVLLHAAHPQGRSMSLRVAFADDLRLLAGRARGKDLKLDARFRVQPAAHGDGDACELRGHVVVQLESHAPEAPRHPAKTRRSRVALGVPRESVCRGLGQDGP
mmetsp:Transcript_47042/g.147420  ORF Transcript_47042/g.147420 Transcript_47042/m.147420 type:complete len:473 (-) Transcript_47042:3-1421(-)